MESENAFPITGGVPLERGALKDAKSVAVRIGDAAVPVQTQQTLRFKLVMHETSWPTFDSCELPLATYEELVKYRRRYSEPPISGAFGTTDLRIGMVRERVQSSVVLRAYYRGDDWRFGNMMKDIGITARRGGPMAAREENAKLFLDHVRKNGVPQKKSK